MKYARSTAPIDYYLGKLLSKIPNLTGHYSYVHRCQTTREHLIYSVDVAPNLASRAGHILTNMATKTSFYDWELRDQAYKLMRMDIDVINRRKLDARMFFSSCDYFYMVYNI